MPRSTATLSIDKGALLLAVTNSKAYNAALLKDAAERAEIMRRTAAAFYQATLDDTNGVFQSGVPGAEAARKQLRVALPNGNRVVVPVAWKPLTEKWRKSKRHRAGKNYKGKHRSEGAGLFWLDEGVLRTAFDGWIKGRGQVSAAKPRIRRLQGGQNQITYALEFKKLPVGFLDVALRRALLRGAIAGRSESALEDLPIPASVPRRGVWRAAWPEAYRPTMRPLAMRLGRAMQEQILKSLRRR